MQQVGPPSVAQFEETLEEFEETKFKKDIAMGLWCLPGFSTLRFIGQV